MPGQFGPQFDELRFKLTSVTEDDLITEARAAAKLFLPDWDIDADGDAAWFALELFLKGVAQGISLANAWANEGNIVTAREETSILAHAASRGFTPASPAPARVKWVMTLPSPLNARSWAAYELKVTTRGVDGPAAELFFENEFPFSVWSGISQVVVDLIAGRSYQQTYTPDATDFQSFILEQPGVLDGSWQLSFASVPWERVESLVDSQPTDLHYTTTLLSDGRTEVGFGDGATGARPPNGIPGLMKYRVGGGAKTNVPPDALQFVFASPTPTPGGTNPLRASGGRDRDPLSVIVKKAIAEWRRSELLGKLRSVEEFCEGWPGIARARAILVGNLVLIAVIADGANGEPADATQAAKDALKAAVDDDLVMGYLSSIVDVIYTPPTIAVDFTTRQGFISAEVEAGIVLDLKALLNPLTKVVDSRTRKLSFRRAFGQKLHVNEVRAVLSARPDIEPDFVVSLPVVDVPVEPTSITNYQGASITATSRNNLTVGFTPP